MTGAVQGAVHWGATMASSRKFIGCVAALSLAVSCAQAAAVIADYGQTALPRALANGGGASRDRVIDAVQKRFNAKVVRVTETTVNGRPALELRLLSEQRVWNVVVDADSGQVLSGG
jgi:uncharacterized membrane protein YkoI